MGVLGAFRGLRFQTWRAPGPPERRKNVENVVSEAPRLHVRVLFGTGAVPNLDAKGVFCHENMINNGVLTGAPFSQSCSKRVAQGGPKGSFGGPFGHFGSSRNASWSTLDTTWHQQDAVLRTDAVPGPKLVPDLLPKRASAAGAQDESDPRKTHI